MHSAVSAPDVFSDVWSEIKSMQKPYTSTVEAWDSPRSLQAKVYSYLVFCWTNQRPQQ